MAPPSTSLIKASVGYRAANQREDVLIVQRLLNEHVQPPLRFLEEDGVCGPRTINAIIEFQRRVVGMSPQDGRVDVGHKTIDALSRKATPPVVQPPPGGAPHAERFKHEMRQEFAEWQMSPQWPAYWKFIAEDATPEIKKFFNLIKRAEEARSIAAFYLSLREWGVDASEVRIVIKSIAGFKDVEKMKELVKQLSSPTGTASKVLSSLKNAGTIVGYVLMVVEYADHCTRGDYHMAAVTAYKFFMGKAIPWAGFVDSLQSTTKYLVPAKYQDARIYIWMKTLDPIGLGAVAIDTLGVLLSCAVEGQINDQRFNRLAERIKKSPASLFYEMGEDLADSLDKISRMSESEFNEMMSWKSVSGWARYLVTGKMPDEA